MIDPSGARPISRFSRPGGPPQRTRVNHLIRITPIRVIGADGEQVGVIETSAALRMAEEAGMDLVEISPDARPPVCKIMDYGKFKYEQSKKDAKNRSTSKASEMKEVRLGRSSKIDPHDVQIRVNQARGFLIEGHKVLITQRFRGREMAHREIGINRLNDIIKQLSDVAKVEKMPSWMGPQASIILTPDKAKADAVRRQMNRDKKADATAEKRDEARRAAAAAALAAGGAPGAAGAAGTSGAPAQSAESPGAATQVQAEGADADDDQD